MIKLCRGRIEAQLASLDATLKAWSPAGKISGSIGHRSDDQ
jgi:hypothetical protein